MNRLRWLLLLTLSILLSLVVFGLPLYGINALRFIPGDYQIEARRISGPLWRPTLHQASIRGPGLEGSAASAVLQLNRLNPFERTARFSLALRDAHLDVNAAELLGGERRSDWQVLPQQLELERVQVTLDGTDYQLPQATLQVGGRDGQLRLQATTRHGAATAKVDYETRGGSLVGRARVSADATLLNHYWNGVRAGRVEGDVRFGNAPLAGEYRLTGWQLVVPQAELVQVSGIQGKVEQRGPRFDIQLSGESHGGPVRATASVDTAARAWTVNAEAAPQVARLAEQLGTAGHGNLRLSARASGWNAANVDATATGSGVLAGVPVRELSGRYTLRGHTGRVQGHVATRAFGEDQQLKLNWTVGAQGTAALKGRLLNEPLDLHAALSPGRLKLNGQALGGKVQVGFDPRTRAVNGSANVRLSGVTLDLSASGQPDDLRVKVRKLQRGDLTLQGTGRFGARGAVLDLGPLKLEVDREGRGTWQASALEAYGVRASGKGELDLRRGLSGQLSAELPLVERPLAGPVQLNWRSRTGHWSFGSGRAGWQDRAVALRLQDTVVAGFTTSADLNYRDGRLDGTAELRQPGTRLRLRALGERLETSGTLRGVKVRSETHLSPGYPTAVHLEGADLTANARYDGGLRFRITSGAELLEGHVQGERTTARGTLDLRSLRQLTGRPDLSGRVTLDLQDGTGQGQLRAASGEAQVQADLTLRGEQLDGQWRVDYQGARLRLDGNVYPRVDLSGTASWQDQQLGAALHGPYDRLTWAVSGSTAPLVASGLRIPAQALDVQGQLTPSLRADGRWGEVRLGWRDGWLSAAGPQAFDAAGLPGLIQLDGRIGADWAGELQAAGKLGEYSWQLRGPWRDLKGHASGRGFQATGALDAASRSFNVQANGRLAELDVRARVSGHPGAFTADGRAFDAQGGSVRFTATSPRDWQAGFSRLNVRSLELDGALRADSEHVTGELRAGNLRLLADGGALRLTGRHGPVTVDGRAALELPATLRDVRLNLTSPWATATLQGDQHELAGELRTLEQRYQLSEAALVLPAQSLPVRVNPAAGSARLGELEYRGGEFSGQLPLTYALAGQAGTLRFQGGTQGLSASLRGPLDGQLQVYPRVEGTLRAALAPLLPDLPADLRAALVPGRLAAQVSGHGAQLSLEGASYLGRALELDARLSLQGRPRVEGTLHHPGSRIPFAVNPAGLRVRSARIDGQALQPLVRAKGHVTGDLNVPGLDWRRAQAQLALELRDGDRAARGDVTLRGGQWHADLHSDLGGRDLSVKGKLYPSARATFRLDGLNGRVEGRADDSLRVRAAGELDGHAAAVHGTLTRQTLTLEARYGEAQATLLAENNDGWRGSLSVNAADLAGFTGQTGQAQARLHGTWRHAEGSLQASLAGNDLKAPLSWQDGQLRTRGATLVGSFGSAGLSGSLYPALDLAGQAELRQFLPGSYAVKAGGSYGAPVVTARGDLHAGKTAGGYALEAPGSVVELKLQGQDWQARASGPSLSGAADGRLDTGVRAARFQTSGTARWPEGRLKLNGTLGWHQRDGFDGRMKVDGRAYDQPARLELSGQGPLRVQGQVGAGRVRAQLPATIAAAPRGTVALETFDLAALWGRGGQLTFSGNATLNGDWSAPGATVRGRLRDAGGDLSGPVQGRYAAGTLEAEFTGDNGKLSAQGAYTQAGYRATIHARDVRLARLLPPGLAVDGLRASGNATVSGAPGRTVRVHAEGLDVRARTREFGDVKLNGELDWTDRELRARLSASLLGGQLQAEGALPEGVQVSVNGIDAARWNLGTLAGRLRLGGSAANPRLSGTLISERPDAITRAVLAGHLRQPEAQLTASLRGELSGELRGKLRELRLQPLSAHLTLEGQARHEDVSVKLGLAGEWPQLRGEARVESSWLPDGLSIQGDGTGRYSLSAGPLGTGSVRLAGLIPQVDARLALNPLPALGASGEGSLNLSVRGPLNALRYDLNGSLRNVARSGVSLGHLGVHGQGRVQEPELEVTQGQQLVARWVQDRLSVEGLRASAHGSDVRVTGHLTRHGALRATLNASGSLDGRLEVAYAGGAASVNGAVEANGARLQVQAAGSEAVGWSGRARLSGLPRDVVTRDGQFTLDGPWNAPRVRGELGLLGANARLVAGTNSARLTLSDGPGARANGTLEHVGGQLRGGVKLSRAGTDVKVDLSGSLERPAAALIGSFGTWQARGDMTPDQGRLLLSDGNAQGHLEWDGVRFKAVLPGLDLAGLGFQGYAGRLSGTGTYDVRQRSGTADLQLQDARTPHALPVVEVPVEGDVRARATLQGEHLSLSGTLRSPRGPLEFDLERAGAWQGKLRAELAGGSGRLQARLSLQGAQLSGRVQANQYPVRWNDMTGELSGEATLERNQYQLDASLRGAALNGALRIGLSGEGDLASVLAENLPRNPLALQPSGGGYTLDARVENLDVQQVSPTPHVRGRLGAQLQLSDGGSRFVVRSQDLDIAGEKLPSRIEGNSYGQEWRVRGYLGDSQLFGSVTAGSLTGRLELRSLPLGAVVGAYGGPLPGKGSVSGLARFTLPLHDPLAGKVEIVAERIQVSSQSERLSGHGTITYANRELPGIAIQLRGNGAWDIQGRYTRQQVDVRALLKDTTFTPFLSLVPSARDARAALRGDVEARLGGRYDQPQATLSARGLNASLADTQVAIPSLNLSLTDGQLSGRASLTARGDVAGSGTLDLSGRLSDGAMSAAQLQFTGDLATRATGPLDKVALSVRQSPAGWNLDGTITRGGVARITGTLAPRLDLSITARGLTPQLGLLFARESDLDADMTVRERGTEYLVDGAIRFNRLTVGRVEAPDGLGREPDTARQKEGGAFNSLLPRELVSFPPPPGERRHSPLLSRIVLDSIPVAFPNGVRVDENLARADLAGALTLQGRADAPKLQGEIKVVRGALFLRENEFGITGGRALFDGTSAYPVFNADASGVVPHDGRRIGIGVSVRGHFPADQAGQPTLDLETTFRCTEHCSTPSGPLTESELYALVAFGTPNVAALPSNLTQSALRTAVNVFLLGEVERGIGKALGLDVFRIRTDLLSGSSDFRVQFTLGSYLTRDFYLQYDVDLTGKGLVNATYTMPGDRFTFTVTSPLQGLDVQSLRPSLAMGYNLTPSSSLQLGVTSDASTTFRLGYTYRY